MNFFNGFGLLIPLRVRLRVQAAHLPQAYITKITQGCQPGTHLILNHDTIPYLEMKRNFMHTLFLGTPLFWGSGYQTTFIEINLACSSTSIQYIDFVWYLLLKIAG